MSLCFAEGGRERILQMGMALAGMNDPAEGAEEALDALASVAAAWCGREDIPEKMEGPLAVLLSRLLMQLGQQPVSQVKRGDTAITYGGWAQGGLGGMEGLLAPFVRLRSPGGRRRHE